MSFMSRNILLGLTLTTILTPLSIVQAAPIDAAGAEQVRAMLQGMHDQQKATLQAQGLTVIEKGKMVVEPKDKFYTATSPNVTIKSAAGSFEYGTTRFNIAPGDKDKEWIMTVALPSPMRILDNTGKETGRLTFDSSKISSVVNENYWTPLKIDARISNIKLEGRDETTSPGSITIGDLTAKSNYNETAPGHYSGPMVVTMNNVSAIGKSTTTSSEMNFSLGNLTLDSKIDDWDMAMAKTYKDKMGELTTAGFDPAQIKSPQSMSAMWKIIMDYGLQQMNGFDSAITLNNLKMNGTRIEPPPATNTAPVAKGIAKAFSISWDSFGYGFGMNGLKGDKSTGHISWFSRNPNFSSSNEIPTYLLPYIPNNADFKLSFQNLPHKALMEQMGALAQTGAAMKADPKAASPNMQMMAMQAMMTVPALLGQAGTVFTLDANGTSPKLNLDIDGTFTAATQALYGGTGTLKAVIGGFDQMVTDLQAASTAPGITPDDAKAITGKLAGLTGVQMMGQQGTDTKGTSARIYNFALDPAGKVTLNGADMSALRGAGKPTPPMPQAAPNK